MGDITFANWINALAQLATPASGDRLVIIDDPLGDPVAKYIEYGDLVVGDDTAYGEAWEDSLLPPTQNAVYNEMETKAGSGANSDITSMTGLNDNGIPVEKIDSDVEQAILGDATKGRRYRQAKLKIQDGTDASTLQCSVFATGFFNGDAISAEDNLAKDGSTTSFTLASSGHILGIKAAAITGNGVAIHAGVYSNASGTAFDVSGYIDSGSLMFQFTVAGAPVDVTSLVDVGTIEVVFLYLTSA